MRIQYFKEAAALSRLNNESHLPMDEREAFSCSILIMNPSESIDQ